MSESGTISNVVNAPRELATFYGTFFHKVSERKQVALPKHQKRTIDEAQEGPLLLMRWQQEQHLRLYTKKQFDKKLAEVKQNPNLSDEQKFSAITGIASSAEPVEPDSQGRFVLPAHWADALGIRDEVAFCGVGSFIQIWPAEMKREAVKAETEKLAAVAPLITSILNI